MEWAKLIVCELLDKNCQLNSGTMLVQKRRKQKIIFVNQNKSFFGTPNLLVSQKGILALVILNCKLCTQSSLANLLSRN